MRRVTRRCSKSTTFVVELEVRALARVLRVVSKTQLAIFEQTTRTGADRRRLAPGMTFEIVSRVHAKQKFVQQHSGDWAMTGRCPSRVRLTAFARTNRKDESHPPRQDHGRIAG